MNTPTNETHHTPTVDPEAIARRVNGAVAADFQAQAIRARLMAGSSAPVPQDVFRRFEAIEAAIYDLSMMMKAAS